MKAWRVLLLAVVVLAVAGAIGLALLIHRGFRATTEPSRFEAVAARTVRDLAIPRGERSRKNPLEPTPQNLNDGREDFMAHCSNCHGHDSGGTTAAGQSLYPRVADLRAAKSQNLTDGELHYIIENGVALTGMPAWGNLHQLQDDDSWKLVLYIRSLRPLTGQEQTQQAQTTASAHYSGSQSCAKCHEEIYEHWQKTPMANVVRDPRQHPDAIIPDLATNNVAKFSKDQVAFVYGSIWKQRYFTKVGDDYFPLPVQWEVKTTSGASTRASNRRRLVGGLLSTGQYASPDRPAM